MRRAAIFLGFFVLVLLLWTVVFFPLLVCLGPADLRVSLGAVRRALRAGGAAAASVSDASPPAPARGGTACGRGCAALSRDTKCRD